MGKNHKKIIIAASGAVAMALSLCACQVGGSTSAPAESKAASDTITMMNYPDWIGENEASAFKDETGYTLKQVSTPDGGDSAWVNIIRQNSGSYDMSLAGMKVAETLDNAGLLEEFDASEVPNLKNIDSQCTGRTGHDRHHLQQGTRLQSSHFLEGIVRTGGKLLRQAPDAQLFVRRDRCGTAGHWARREHHQCGRY